MNQWKLKATVACLGLSLSAPAIAVDDAFSPSNPTALIEAPAVKLPEVAKPSTEVPAIEIPVISKPVIKAPVVEKNTTQEVAVTKPKVEDLPAKAAEVKKTVTPKAVTPKAAPVKVINKQSQKAEASATKAVPKKSLMADSVVVIVNGEKITHGEVQAIWNGLFPGEGEAPPIEKFGDAIRDNVVRGIVSERLMLREAERGKLSQRRDVREKLEAARRQVLVQEHLRVRNANVTPEDIRKRYDEMVAKLKGRTELRASHILVEDEETANKLYKQIKDGRDFALIAKNNSADVGSAAAGGDLGYFAPDQMVPEFSEAAQELEKDEISSPVKSPFGWHIIKLSDKRDKPLPPFDEAKITIEQQLRDEANQNYIANLLKNSDVKYFDQKGKEIELPIEPIETDT